MRRAERPTNTRCILWVQPKHLIAEPFFCRPGPGYCCRLSRFLEPRGAQPARGLWHTLAGNEDLVGRPPKPWRAGYPVEVLLEA